MTDFDFYNESIYYYCILVNWILKELLLQQENMGCYNKGKPASLLVG